MKGNNIRPNGTAILGKIGIAIVVLALAVFQSCGGGTGSENTPARTEEKSGTATPPAGAEALPVVLATAAPDRTDPVPIVEKALIVFLSGTAEKHSGGAWNPLEIGDSLVQGDAVRTGEDSYCELQCGIQAVIRIRENTTFSLTKAELHAEKSHVAAEVLAGSVLCKVQKLSGDSRFEVRTESAVCAVRGTEFMVSVGKDVATKLSVKEGEVSIVPKSVSLENLRASEDPAIAMIAETALEKMEAAATKVGADREVVVTAVDAKNAELIGRTFETSLQKIAETLRTTGSTGQELPAEIESSIEAVAVAAAQKAVKTVDVPSTATKETKDTLAELERMRIIELRPETGATDSEPESGTGDGVPQSETASTADTVRLRTISVRVEPAEAAVYSEDGLIAAGGFTGLYAGTEVLNLSVRLEGYVTENVVIDLNKETGGDFLISLEKNPQILKVSAKPDGAEILIDGERVGKGTWSGKLEAGKTVEVTARLQGYRDAKTSVETKNGDTRTLELTLEPVMVQVSVSVQPAEAELVVNGRNAGKGSNSASYRIGTTLTVNARLAGYEPGSVVHTVTENGDNRVRLSLRKIRKDISISVIPSDASIVIDGVAAGTGRAAGTWDVGRTLSVELKREGYTPLGTSIAVTETVKPSYSFTLEQEKRTVTVKTTPSDASVLENGKVLGKGSVTLTRPLGDETILAVERDGYDGASIAVGFKDPVKKELTVTLSMKAVYARTRLSDAKLVGIEADESGSLFAVSDSDGQVAGVDRNGKLLWKVRTANTENENSVPVVAGGTVYFSGSKELVALNAGTGSIVWRKELSSDESHIFGQRVFPSGGRVFLPTSDGVITLSDTGETLKTAFKVEGNLMSPTVAGDTMVIADQKGTVFVFNPIDGTMLSTIATGAVQPVAQRMAVEGRTGYLAGRKGNVACVNLGTGKVLWQAVPKKNVTGMFNDLIPGSNEVIAYASGSIMVLDKTNGNLKFAPVEGATAPPEFRNGALWFGRDKGDIALMNVANGRIEKTFNPGGKTTAKPHLAGSRLYLLLDTGELAVLQIDAVP